MSFIFCSPDSLSVVLCFFLIPLSSFSLPRSSPFLFLSYTSQLRAVLHLISSSGYLSSFTHHVCLFVTPLLIDLHWLPVAARIKFKPLMIAYRVIAGSAPTYLNALVRANVNIV